MSFKKVNDCIRDWYEEKQESVMNDKIPMGINLEIGLSDGSKMNFKTTEEPENHYMTNAYIAVRVGGRGAWVVNDRNVDPEEETMMYYPFSNIKYICKYAITGD